MGRKADGVNRVGLYAWGGPGTIRLLAAKYHAPRVDRASFMHLYDREFLTQARQILGVTDMWVTYSWGFSDATEQEDRRFIVERLPHFHAEGIAAHAYIQGLNLVTGEFAGQDVFCRDSYDKLLPYSKDRSLTCPNNPQARQIILDRVTQASREAFAGIFIDNIVFGLPPFYFRRDYTSFFGCSCSHCQERFAQEYGYPLPLNEKVGTDPIRDYLRFRCQSTFDLLEAAAAIAHGAGKQFGVNLYDPLCHSPEIHFGYSLDRIAPLLDYYLIENHALDKCARIDNTHLQPLIESTDKPVFVVSYRDGIGYDPAYSQDDINAIWGEAAALGYAPCLKATEFVTRGTWHALDISRIQPPVAIDPPAASPGRFRQPARSSRGFERWLVRALNRPYTGLVRAAFQNRVLARLMHHSRLYMFVLKSCNHLPGGTPLC